jgi:predicted DNA-binding protein YlxM (UPF0122 family)
MASSTPKHPDPAAPKQSLKELTDLIRKEVEKAREAAEQASDEARAAAAEGRGLAFYSLRAPKVAALFPENTSERVRLDYDVGAGRIAQFTDTQGSLEVPFRTVAELSHPVSALHYIYVFHSRVVPAAVLLSAAFAEAAVTDFRPRVTRLPSRRKRRGSNWYLKLLDTSIATSREVRNALVHQWKPTARAERLATDAFALLTDLTPARNELWRLCKFDRPRAFSELAKHLEVVTDQFELSAKLLEEIEAPAEDSERLPAEQQFAALREKLLAKAGGVFSLTDAADLLRVSRQALHKQIRTSKVLGMMHGRKLVLPKAQFLDHEGKTELLPGLSKLLPLFNVAGGWSALQFLVEPDPNLRETPFQALAKGRIDDVLNAAHAYLD